ncbi:MAG TPA: TetR/AcrR family transcriptional regulator [Actinotalea sp.]|nr:TetR/AcrR family transcriptional regulator [Actinotalea sp.]
MPDPVRTGRPRSEDTRIAILTAAARQVAANGYDHMTVEGVAAEAGVGKQTIYRWWGAKSALVADCLVEGLLLTELFVPEDSGDLHADVITWLENITRFLHHPGNTGLMHSLIVAAGDNPDVVVGISERLGLWEMLGRRFGTAVAAGQLAAGIPLDVLGDALLGALVLRELRGAEEDPDFTRHLVELLMPAPGHARS